MLVSAQAGIIRRLASIQQGLNCDNNTKGVSNWETDVSGAIAEYAFAKYAKIFWAPSINTFKEPDVGIFQVRSTSYKNGQLIIQKNDRDNDPYVLLRGAYHNWEVAGWMRGKDAKQDQYWKEEKNSYWVPATDLEPIETILEVAQ